MRNESAQIVIGLKVFSLTSLKTKANLSLDGRYLEIRRCKNTAGTRSWNLEHGEAENDDEKLNTGRERENTRHN